MMRVAAMPLTGQRPSQKNRDNGTVEKNQEENSKKNELKRVFFHESNPGQECINSHMCPGLSRLSRSETCAAWGMSRVRRQRQMCMMAKNYCEKICRMVIVSMTERSQGLHSGGSGIYKGRDASKSSPLSVRTQ